VTTAGPGRAEDLLAAATASLAESHRVYMDIARTYWDPGEDLTARAVIFPVSAADLAAGRLKGNWERMAAALARRPAGARGYAVVVSVYDDGGGKAVWTGEYPLDPVPLARAAQKLVPDATIFSRMDPPAAVAVRVPADWLRAGHTYRLALSFRDPDGKGHAFPDGSTPESAPAVTVRAGRLDLAKLRRPCRVTDAADLLTRAEQVANPGRRRFPKDDPDDCQARSVWCLQSFGGRVYVGFGDWVKNRGPIPLWSFGPDDDALARRYGRYSFAVGGNPRLLFTHEYTVQEHSIDRYRVWGDRLVVPGVDGYKEAGPDGIAFANVYVREKGHWRKLSTLPEVVHVTDALGLGERLYAQVDRFAGGGPAVVVSEDVGLSWTRAAPGDGELAPYRGGVLSLEGTRAQTLAAGRTTSRRGEFTPGGEPDPPHRVVPFSGGVVYTTSDNFGRSRAKYHPLFFLADAGEGPRLVGPFHDKSVRDVSVAEGTLYVLAGGADPRGGFAGEVYSSRDLTNWVRLAAFPVPATPNALAALGGVWYVGLANRGYDPAECDDLKPSRYAFADAASGCILRLAR
jgi:hypothetical protein